MKDCPKCGLVNPPNAQECDCGYSFSTGAVQLRCPKCRSTDGIRLVEQVNRGKQAAGMILGGALGTMFMLSARQTLCECRDCGHMFEGPRRRAKPSKGRLALLAIIVTALIAVVAWNIIRMTQ